MKKLLLSLLTVGVVSAVAIGATRAYFSDTEEVLGNSIQTGVIDFNLNLGNAYGGLNFPVTLMPGGNTNFIDPNGLEHDQRITINFAPGSVLPNHFEIKFSADSFVDGLPESGSTSTMDEYLKAVEVANLYNHTDGWSFHGLTSKINNSLDGDTSFLSLYDLVNTPVIDDILVGSTLNSYGFVFKMDEDAGNNLQGDSLNLNIMFGAAQIAGQSVL